MMIRKNLGSTYEQGMKIEARKSAWMVFYLRARRNGDCLKGFYRKHALIEARAKIGGKDDSRG